MDTKTSRTVASFEALPILAAFMFVTGLLIGSSTIMFCSAIPLAIRASLHVVNYARPVPQHFRKHRPAVRYTR
jgi:hypothetical protein